MEFKTAKNPYQETIDNIFLLRVELNNLIRDRNRIITSAGPKSVQAQSYDIKTGGSKVENVNDLYSLIIETEKKIQDVKKRLEIEKEKKRKIEENFLIHLNDTEKKVFILKIRELSHLDIAIKLHKSEGYVKNISYLIDRKMEEWSINLQKTVILI